MPKAKRAPKVRLVEIPLSKARYGTVLLFYPSSPFGHAVVQAERRGYSQALYSHVGMARRRTKGRLEFYESIPSCGLHISVIDERRGNVRAFDVVGAQPRADSVMLEAVSAGTEYSIGRILQMAVFYYLGLALPKKYDRRYVCADSVNYAYRFGLADTPAGFQRLIADR